MTTWTIEETLLFFSLPFIICWYSEIKTYIKNKRNKHENTKA